MRLRPIFKLFQASAPGLQSRPVANQGVVALITSIIVSLLLTVITASGIRIMNAELRQATDFDLSVKAYFAAESGVEDAIAHVRRNGVSGSVSPDCDVFNQQDANLSADGVVAYTCQVVRVDQTEVVGELKKEASRQIDLAGLNFNRLVISWNQEGTSDPNWSGAIPLAFPPTNTWSDQYPAILETTLVSYPQTPTFDSDSVQAGTVIFKPHPSGSSNPSINIQQYTPPAVPPPSEQPVNTNCQPSGVNGTYECQATIQVPASRNYTLRLHARYSSAHFKVEAFNGSNPVTIPNSQLVIDVTGKAGDVFRRIQAKSFLSESSPLPFVILTDSSICKVLEISGGDASSETGC